MSENRLLWQPAIDRIAHSQLSKFSAYAGKHTGHDFANYDELHTWSIGAEGEFWSLLWDYAGIIGEKGGRTISDGGQMPDAQFFPDARLNFAENLLARNDESEAIVFRAEDKVERRLTFKDLNNLTSLFQQVFKNLGLGKGDRVAAMLPNMPEALAAMLAAASLGAVWSSCSPDFGPRGVLDRFGQISPKLFLACDGYWYNGKRLTVREKLEEIVPGLGNVQTLIVPLLGEAEKTAQAINGAQSLDTVFEGLSPKPVTFERFDFNHPLFILYSSGTTGVPKCIMHSHGGCLLKLRCEHLLHMDMREGDRVFFFTTCGWMMWNWLIGAIAGGVTLILYDGSPFYPAPSAMFEFAEAEWFTLFGTSAKFIDAVRLAGIEPAKTHDLKSVRMICSTGSPLADENFDFVYASVLPDAHLASMSGGTDIMGCFVAGIPSKPVYRSEIQGPVLGMAVEVWDDDGQPLEQGKGELVCVRPFPSMPIGFWGDENASKYRAAYFDRFNNVWCHGDFAEWTANGGMIIHGRSDATLNPGGVRIGTAEIYNQVEQIQDVEEAICIGQQWHGDTRVVLFVRLAKGARLNEDLKASIKDKVRNGASPRHVPAIIIAVPDIPRTKSGKITELAVRDVVHGLSVKNKEALANPEALDFFKDLAELKG